MEHVDRQTAPTLLIVDDDQALREQLARAFRRRGYDVWVASNAREALELFRQRTFQQAVFDLKMPGQSGIDLLREVRTICPDTRVVILTGFGSIANAIEAIRLGAVNYVPKPAHADDVIKAFQSSSSPALPADVEPAADSGTPSLAQAEWEHIQRVLADCDGNISRTAFNLGISRRSLQRKLRKLAP